MSGRASTAGLYIKWGCYRKGASMAKKRKQKGKQGFLPDMEPPSIPEIERAADLYLEARNARMNGLQEEVKLRGVLELVMHKHDLKAYSYEDKTVTLEAQEKVKVRKKQDKEGTGGDEE